MGVGSLADDDLGHCGDDVRVVGEAGAVVHDGDKVGAGTQHDAGAFVVEPGLVGGDAVDGDGPGVVVDGSGHGDDPAGGDPGDDLVEVVEAVGDAEAEFGAAEGVAGFVVAVGGVVGGGGGADRGEQLVGAVVAVADGPPGGPDFIGPPVPGVEMVGDGDYFIPS